MKVYILNFLALALLYQCTAAILTPGLSEGQLAEELVEFLRPYSSVIRQWFWTISGVQQPPSQLDHGGPQARADFITCDLCVQAAPIVRQLYDASITEEIIVNVATTACLILGLAPRPDICRPTIVSYAHSVLHILTVKPDVSVDDFCGIINPGCTNVSSQYTDWKIRVGGIKPETPTRPLITTGNSTKILQFTDIHLDLDYVTGMNASCGLPVCCRKENIPGPNPNASEIGGIYGHNYCALPLTALEAIFDHAKENHQDTEMIFLTGDYVHSGVWLYSVEENSKHIEKVTQLLAEKFPDIPIFPLTGNHEPDVVNLYPPVGEWDNFDLGWMYEAVAKPFLRWIPPLQLATFKKFGYYSVTPDNNRNLRIVVVNTNICYTNNFWLPFDPIDPNNQLQWLSDTLHSAETQGQHVLLLGHIQPGSGSCWPVWSNQFNRIINRYEGIIRGQFYGHSHEQYYTLAFEDGTDRPISVSYIAGSGLTDRMDSAYNVYYVDGERGAESTWEVMNQQTYVLKLEQSNAAEEPIFQRLVDAKSDFNLTSMRPEAMYDFVKRMICDEDLFIKYQEVKNKGRNTLRFEEGVCRNNNTCKGQILGEMLVSNSADESRIEIMRDLIESNCLAGDDTESGSQNVVINAYCFLGLVFSLVFINLMG